MVPPLLVCRTAWMDHYRGVTAMDTPIGGGAWVKEHGFGHEAFNFAPVRNEFFGFVQSKGAGINLSRLGGGTEDGKLDGVTVAWVATHPAEGGTRIVGWYRNATVFAAYQKPPEAKGRRLPDGRAPRFLVRANQAVLLDRDARVFDVPRGKGGMGQSNTWYPDKSAAVPILSYIGAGGGRSSDYPRPKSPRLSDVKRRLRVEGAAMTAAAKWFAERGYEVRDVSMERLGWDLEASRRRARLKVEVKGTSLDAEDFVVEVTPNEYAKMTGDEHRAAYRLCVVTDCEAEPLVTVFAWSPESGAWASGDGAHHLKIEERVAARISAVSM